MAKKKPAKAKPMTDRRERFLVALPEEYRELVEAMIAKSRRTITVEVQIALEEWAKANGIEPPKANQ